MWSAALMSAHAAARSELNSCSHLARSSRAWTSPGLSSKAWTSEMAPSASEVAHKVNVFTSSPTRLPAAEPGGSTFERSKMLLSVNEHAETSSRSKPVASRRSEGVIRPAS